MISDDIIKKIKFVFAGDNKDLKKTLDETNKAASALAKNFDLEKQSKVLDKFIKNLGTTNKELTKTMQGVQKGFTDIASKDFDKFTKKVEGAYKSLQETQRKIETAQRSGDTAEIQRLQKVQKYQQSNMNNSMSAANTAAGIGGAPQSPAPQGGMLSQLAGISGVMGAGYAAMRSLALIPNFAKSAGEMNINNQATLGGLARANVQKYLSGDISQHYVMGKDDGKAQNEVIDALEQGSASRVLTSGLWGGIKGTWNAASKNDRFFWDGAIEGGRQGYRTSEASDHQELIDKRMQNSMDPVYLQNIQQNAVGRFAMQSSFGGMSDAQYAKNLGSLKGSRMTESDMQNFAAQNRSTMGSYYAEGMLDAPGRIRNATGMSMGISNSLMQATNLNGSGAGNMKDQVIDMFAKGFKNGITDSGLLESILKGTTSIAQSFGSRVDMARMSGEIANVANTLGGDARATQGAISGKEFYNGMMKGNDELGMFHTAYAASATGGIKNVAARSELLNELSNKNPDEIMSLINDPSFKERYTASGSISSEEFDSVTNKYKNGKYNKALMNSNPTLRRAQSEIQKAMSRGYTEEQATAMIFKNSGGIAFGNYGTEESRGATGLNAAGINNNATGSDWSPLSLDQSMNNTQSGVYTGALSNNPNQISKDSIENIGMVNFDNAIKTQQYDYKTNPGFGLGGSVDALIEALRNFATAATTETQQNYNPKISGKE